jgi:uncharacterized cupin superfamily protein
MIQKQTAQQAFQGVLIHAHAPDLETSLVPLSVDDLPPEEEIGFRIEGRPELAMRVVWVSEDRRTAVLIERCGPCKVIGKHFTEVFYLVKGGWTAKRPDGTEYEIKAGDFACYAEGQAEEATVRETFVKCSMYHASRPLPYEVTP